MGRYLLARFLQGLIVIFGVTVVVFVTTRLIGDPVDFILPLSASPEQRARLRTDLGFDRSIMAQFWDYITDLLRFDFGTSTYFRNRGTMSVVGEFLPRTLQLVVMGMGLALAVSVVLGTTAALRPGRATDKVLVVLSLAGLATPQFFLCQLLLLYTSVQFKLVQFGPGPWTHLIVPSIGLALPAIGRLAMVVRSTMIDELNSQYVKAARAKGLARNRIVYVHALRNASIPVITLFGWEVIRALAGFTVVVENVFNWPGLGNLAIIAIKQRDFFLIQTIVLVVALMVVAINITIDLVYRYVDPRVKLK